VLLRDKVRAFRLRLDRHDNMKKTPKQASRNAGKKRIAIFWNDGEKPDFFYLHRPRFDFLQRLMGLSGCTATELVRQLIMDEIEPKSDT